MNVFFILYASVYAYLNLVFFVENLYLRISIKIINIVLKTWYSNKYKIINLVRSFYVYKTFLYYYVVLQF